MSHASDVAAHAWTPTSGDRLPHSNDATRTLKKTLEKVLAKVRRRRTRSGLGGTGESSPEGAPSVPAPRGVTVTGRTIFGDRPLRFRRMTLPDPDMPALDDPSNFESAFKIRIAHLSQTRRDAQVLVERQYAGRGYQIPVVKKDPYLMTFLAYDEGQIVGTVSIRLDSADRGLSSDDLYRLENNELRAKGWRICEFTQLAVDTAVASKPVLASLFHTAYLYAAVVREYTYSVIEVNPRHVSYYGRALKFEQIGPVRMNRRVQAPAVLLGVSFATIAEGIAEHAGKPRSPDTRGLLFRYGFPPDEQLGVLNRLRELVPTE